MAKRNLVDQRFGYLTVLQDSRKRASNGGVIWTCQCDCGKIVEVAGNNLTRKKHPTQSCGCKTPAKDLSQQRFGSLVAIRPTDQRSNGKVVWECQCDCGKTHYVSSANLANGSVKTCGKCNEPLKKPIPHEEKFIGQQFGIWEILEATPQRANGYIVYLSRCQKCGYVAERTIPSMRSALHKCENCRVDDLTGNKYGLLTVKSLNKIENRISYWTCECECGTTLTVSASNLKTGNTKSCGCLRESAGELCIKSLLEQLNIDFTCQQTFETCRFEDTQALARFDFYLPAFNILIEYDGIQHFQQRDGWEELSRIQKRDQFKNNWCKENNISLIRIPYTDYSKLDKNYILSLINTEVK